VERARGPVWYAKYRLPDHTAAISIEGQILGGTFPARPLRLVTEWAAMHSDDLLANWERAREHKPLEAIEPLS
jgi:Domain of unknown function (DUF4160)